MTILDEVKQAKISDVVKHQGIGGKVITIERELSLEEVLDLDTIASLNFMQRRRDLILVGMVSKSNVDDIVDGKYTLDDFNAKADEFYKNTKCYYGHVDNLGYFVCEDEIEFI